MWANMRIIVLLNSLKVGVTRSLRTRQMLRVDLCAKRVGAYAPYAPPPAYVLVFSLWHMTNRTFVLFFFTLPIPVTESTQSMVTSMKQTFERR